MNGIAQRAGCEGLAPSSFSDPWEADLGVPRAEKMPSAKGSQKAEPRERLRLREQPKRRTKRCRQIAIALPLTGPWRAAAPRGDTRPGQAGGDRGGRPLQVRWIVPAGSRSGGPTGKAARLKASASISVLSRPGGLDLATRERSPETKALGDAEPRRASRAASRSACAGELAQGGEEDPLEGGARRNPDEVAAVRRKMRRREQGPARWLRMPRSRRAWDRNRWVTKARLGVACMSYEIDISSAAVMWTSRWAGRDDLPGIELAVSRTSSRPSRRADRRRARNHIRNIRSNSRGRDSRRSGTRNCGRAARDRRTVKCRSP